MERPSVSDLMKLFENLLRKFEQDEGLVITHVEEEAGCELGDNYMSVVMRTVVKGSRKNGTSYRKTFMTKYLPTHREITSLFRTQDLFKNEIYFYEKLLPVLENFGPICYHADDNRIIMEDLGSLGYVVLDRRELLDYDHSVAAVQTLARLHATSLALKLKDVSEFFELTKPLKEGLFPRDGVPTLGVTINGSLTTAIKQLESIKSRSEDLKRGIKFLKDHEDKAYKVMQELVVPGKGEFDVLTHGDCWNNNVMFKHDPEGNVSDVKLLDFQMSRHGSPAIDFHYFVYSSPKSVVIENNYEQLIAAYHKTFVETLEKKLVPKNFLNQLTIGWFENELNIYSKYGIFTGCWIANAVLAEDHQLIDMDDVDLKFIEEMKNKEVILSPRIADRLRCILEDYVRRYM